MICLSWWKIISLIAGSIALWQAFMTILESLSQKQKDNKTQNDS